MEHVEETDELHVGEWDVFDLFNACNGIVDDKGLLDVEQLNHYTPDEAEELNIPALRMIWRHLADGCAHCDEIVRNLQKLRKTLRARSTERPTTEEIDDTGSIS